MNFADAVMDHLVKRLELPPSVIEILYLLLIREPRPRDVPTETLVANYTAALYLILSRLPTVHEVGTGFSVPIRELVDVTIPEAVGLMKVATKYFYIPDRSGIETYLKNFEGDYISKWLGHGVFGTLLDFRVGVVLSDAMRAQHTHVMGYSGSGKTTLVQHQIIDDIKSGAGVVVMTPKGELIPTLERLRLIEPERLIVVRPSHPFAFNLFDMQGQHVHVIELINFVLRAALGDDAHASAKQAVLLNYCVSLLLRVPNATLLTLSKILRMTELAPEYMQYVELLAEPQQDFFREDFKKAKDYGETKAALSWRIGGLLDNPIVNSMFAHPTTRFNLGKELERGAVVLIDTSEGMTGTSGSSFIGRFFIALTLLFAQQRGTNGRPVWVYIDECQSFFTDSIEQILEKSREAKVGMTLIHQHEGQLTKYSTALRDSVNHNTSIKFNAVKPYHFSLNVRGLPPLTIQTRPLPDMEKRTDHEMRLIYDDLRARYATPTAPPPPPEAKKPDPPKPPHDDSWSDIE